VEATLDLVARTMQELAAQFPAEEQRQRACGFLAVTQARAGRFREARATAESGACAGKPNPNVIVSVLKQIADCQSRAGDFERAFQALRGITAWTDRSEAVWTLIEEQARAGDCAGARSSVERAIREGVLPASPRNPDQAQAVEYARKQAAQCPRDVPADYWDRLRPELGRTPPDLQSAMAAVAARRSPEQILQGFSEISDRIYFQLLAVSRAPR
jgi:hypothetical protein